MCHDSSTPSTRLPPLERLAQHHTAAQHLDMLVANVIPGETWTRGVSEALLKHDPFGYPMMDPWDDWYIYLLEWLIFVVYYR